MLEIGKSPKSIDRGTFIGNSSLSGSKTSTEFDEVVWPTKATGHLSLRHIFLKISLLDFFIAKT